MSFEDVKPVGDESDVLAEFPSLHRRSTSAPVRDTFVGGFTAGFLEYQDIASYAASQCDPTQATGDQLKAFADERGVIPGESETEDAVRARLFAAPLIVTPYAIVTLVNRILALYTTKTCRVAELELDGIYATDGTSEWSSYIGTDPEYPDRYYSDLPDLDPGGSIPCPGFPRNFFIRIPALEGNDLSIAYVLNDSDDGVFIDDGTGSFGTYIFTNPELADNIYAQIVALITSVKGQSISWSLLVDPSL